MSRKKKRIVGKPLEPAAVSKPYRLPSAYAAIWFLLVAVVYFAALWLGQEALRTGYIALGVFGILLMGLRALLRPTKIGTKQERRTLRYVTVRTIGLLTLPFVVCVLADAFYLALTGRLV